MYCKSVSVSLTVYSMGDPLIITYNYDCLLGVSLQSQHILAYGVRHVEVSLYLSVQTTGCTPVAHGRVPKIGKTFSSSAELHFHHHTPSHTPYRSLPVLSISVSICFPTPHLRSARLSPQQNRDF